MHQASANPEHVEITGHVPQAHEIESGNTRLRNRRASNTSKGKINKPDFSGPVVTPAGMSGSVTYGPCRT